MEQRRRRAGAWSRGPVFGDATAEACIGTRIQSGALGPLRGRTYAHGRRHCSALRVPSWPQPERDGALSNGFWPLRAHWGEVRTRSRSDRAGAHFVVGRPCNIDILLRVILLKLHPTSPPSHTCLYMK